MILIMSQNFILNLLKKISVKARSLIRFYFILSYNVQNYLSNTF